MQTPISNPSAPAYIRPSAEGSPQRNGHRRETKLLIRCSCYGPGLIVMDPRQTGSASAGTAPLPWPIGGVLMIFECTQVPSGAPSSAAFAIHSENLPFGPSTIAICPDVDGVDVTRNSRPGSATVRRTPMLNVAPTIEIGVTPSGSVYWKI